MHVSEFFSFIVEHFEPVSKTGGIILAVCATAITALKRFYRNYSKVKDKNILANIRYLERYGRYLSDDDKSLISGRIANEVLQNVLKSKIAINRAFLSYIYGKLDDKSLFNDLLKVQGSLVIQNGNFSVVPARVFGFSFWFERLLALACAVLFVFFIYASMLVNLKYEHSSAFLIFLLLALACEMVTFYCLSATPGKNRIKKINAALSLVEVKPEWL
ncbi:hypothetical protein PUG46_14520 [Erwiniaceae bacterium L1_55_4]|nr:hypothetical protein [Erwiniaceae bacterium L1_55_4]